eukprot:TRINITY_DN56180_c0_g1_i1.p1 TRINITY_DN56180_c0_g1~~TRINITY_DN56180_c0_g1_i1.p1  ORF type:complete len:164 (-),score=56.70 TRINITY_DN56180_c0_g1_i1:125-616(-)
MRAMVRANMKEMDGKAMDRPMGMGSASRDLPEDLEALRRELDGTRARVHAAEGQLARRDVEAKLVKTLKEELARNESEADQARQERAKELERVVELARAAPDQVEKLLKLQMLLEQEQKEGETLKVQVARAEKKQADDDAWLEGCHLKPVSYTHLTLPTKRIV